jgi:hypothetical protein
MPTFRVRVSDGKTEAVLVENFASEAQIRELLPKRGWTEIRDIEAVPDTRAGEGAAPIPPPIRAGQLRQTGSWAYLPEALARQHPLHGIGGWTAVLLALLIVGAIYGAWGLLRLADALGAGAGPIALLVFALLLAIEALNIAVIVLLLQKSRAFPVCFIVLAGLGLALTLGALLLGTASVGRMVGLAANLVWLLYVILSSRVNLTFLNRLPREDDWLKRGLERGAGRS